MSDLGTTLLLAEAAPLEGRLAFGAVFLALICWLLLMPKSLLEEREGSNPKPIWKRARPWAICIATLQLLIYLFWK